MFQRTVIFQKKIIAKTFISGKSRSMSCKLFGWPQTSKIEERVRRQVFERREDPSQHLDIDVIVIATRR